MITPIAQAIQICGLSQQEAADYLDVSLSTVKSWCSGRRTLPVGVWRELGQLYHDMRSDINDIQDRETGFKVDPDQWPSQRCAVTLEAMARLTSAMIGQKDIEVHPTPVKPTQKRGPKTRFTPNDSQLEQIKLLWHSAIPPVVVMECVSTIMGYSVPRHTLDHHLGPRNRHRYEEEK